MYSIQTTVEPTELLSRADAKAHCKIDVIDDDTYIDFLITSVRKWIEKTCAISIGSQTKIWMADLQGGKEIEIPYGPVISITSAAYKTDLGSTYTTGVASTDYDSDGLEFKTFTPFFRKRWKVTYTCGYTSIPADIKEVWLMVILYIYENRGDVPANFRFRAASTAIPEYVTQMLNPHKRIFGI